MVTAGPPLDLLVRLWSYEGMKETTVRLPDDLHEKIRRVAFERRDSMNAIIVAILRDVFPEEETP
jgi:predicted transcriptional regulator